MTFLSQLKTGGVIVREGAHCYILQQSRTRNLVDYIPPLYSDLPFYACAGGKILLSELPISLAEQIINSCEMVPLTEHTVMPSMSSGMFSASAKAGTRNRSASPSTRMTPRAKKISPRLTSM